jgi:hypothetical protein
VGFDDWFHIHRDDFTVSHDDLAVDHGEFCALRGAEERGSHRIVQRAGVADGVQVEGEEVGAFPGLERTNVGASKNARATQRILDRDCSSRNRSLVSTNQTANANDSDL